MSKNGLIKQHAPLISSLVKLIDILLLLLSGWVIYLLRFDHFDLSRRYLISLIFGGILILPVATYFKVYQSLRGKSILHSLKKLAGAIITLMCILMVIAFVTKESEQFSRLWFFMWMMAAFILMAIFRIFLMYLLRFMRNKGWNQRRIAIIGGGKLAEDVIENARHAMWAGFKVVAWLVETRTQAQKYNIEQTLIPSRLDQYLTDAHIEEIWIAVPLKEEERVKSYLQQVQHNVVTIRYFPDVFGMDLLNHSVSELLGFPVLNLKSSPMVGINRMIKAIEDRVLTLIFIILLSPVMLIIAFLVKLTSPGPVIYKQKRLGWDGKPITVYKFRTMIVHQEADGRFTQATRDDVRFTGIGKILRQASLDELPQLFNVLQGRMSIVGPRPHVLVQNECYKDIVPSYMQRHQVKPGITGWAQVNGWRGAADSLEKLEKRTEYDLFYINNWSLWFDLKIIVMTLFSGMINKNAY